MKFNYKHTLYAGFAGYIVQSIVNSFVPLLFITFQKSYSLPLSRITLLITINFLIQLVIDLLSPGLSTASATGPVFCWHTAASLWDLSAWSPCRKSARIPLQVS